MFLMPPTAAELENRLRGRGTEDEATIKARLARATQEAEGVEGYDYIVINDTVDACTQRIHEIVTSEKMKASHNLTLIEDIREDLKIYSELMNVINSGVEEGEQPLVQSRYSIVKAAATRAKQIIDSRAIEEKLLKMPEKDKDKVSEPVLSDDEEFRLKLGEPTIPKSSNMKPLSIAVEELYEGKVKIVNNANDISEDE